MRFKELELDLDSFGTTVVWDHGDYFLASPSVHGVNESEYGKYLEEIEKELAKIGIVISGFEYDQEESYRQGEDFYRAWVQKRPLELYLPSLGWVSIWYCLDYFLVVPEVAEEKVLSEIKKELERLGIETEEFFYDEKLRAYKAWIEKRDYYGNLDEFYHQLWKSF